MTDLALLPLCHLDDIPEGGSRGFEWHSHKLLVVRQGQRLYVYRNRCPHLGIPLEWVQDQFLDASGTLIQCASHGALFVIHSGQCVAGPCSGQRLEAVPFDLQDGQLFIRV